MTPRQLEMLTALANRPCATLGPCDLIDADYSKLVRLELVHEYWGSGGVMCSATEVGRAYIDTIPQKDTDG
jgi:hypothetical protein